MHASSNLWAAHNDLAFALSSALVFVADTLHRASVP